MQRKTLEDLRLVVHTKHMLAKFRCHRYSDISTMKRG